MFTPVPGLLLSRALGVAASAIVDQSALVNLEELELRFVDVLAIAGTRSEVGGGPAVVAAVPTFLAAVAGAGMVPVESHSGAGGDCSRVRGR